MNACKNDKYKLSQKLHFKNITFELQYTHKRMIFHFPAAIIRFEF
jgi:hypothetical protein